MFYKFVEQARLIWVEEVISLDYTCYAINLKRKIAELEGNLRVVESMFSMGVKDEEFIVILSKMVKHINTLLGIWDVEVESLEDKVYCPPKVLRLKMFKVR